MLWAAWQIMQHPHFLVSLRPEHGRPRAGASSGVCVEAPLGGRQDGDGGAAAGAGQGQARQGPRRERRRGCAWLTLACAGLWVLLNWPAYIALKSTKQGGCPGVCVHAGRERSLGKRVCAASPADPPRLFE